MKVLQVCNNYFGTKIYSDLFEHLSRFKQVDVQILVILPKDQITIDFFKSNQEKANGIHVLLIPRFVYLLAQIFPEIRVNYCWKAMLGLLRGASFDLVHSHTVFSNGTLGSALAKHFRVPHVISVRNADVNTVYKKHPFSHSKLKKNLNSANGIIFINPSYQRFVEQNLFRKSPPKPDNTGVIPNLIDSFWTENSVRAAKKLSSDTVRVLFVGEYTANKNINFLLDVLTENSELSKYSFEIKLAGYLKATKENVVFEQLLRKRVDLLPNCELVGEVKEKQTLLELYSESDLFFMVSKYETFGLVYVEAMSQGLPLVYTLGQGIDGYFENGVVGFATDPNDIAMARKNVQKIAQNYSQFSNRSREAFKTFENSRTVSSVFDIYQKAIQNFHN